MKIILELLSILEEAKTLMNKGDKSVFIKIKALIITSIVQNLKTDKQTQMDLFKIFKEYDSHGDDAIHKIIAECNEVVNDFNDDDPAEFHLHESDPWVKAIENAYGDALHDIYEDGEVRLTEFRKKTGETVKCEFNINNTPPVSEFTEKLLDIVPGLREAVKAGFANSENVISFESIVTGMEEAIKQTVPNGKYLNFEINPQYFSFDAHLNEGKPVRATTLMNAIKKVSKGIASVTTQKLPRNATFWEFKFAKHLTPAEVTKLKTKFSK